MRFKTLSVLKKVVIFISFCVIAYLLHIYLPAQHNPFRKLDLNDPIGIATYTKLTLAKHRPSLCFDALNNTSVIYTRIQDKKTARGCGFYNALSLQKIQIPYSASLRMTCIQAAALSIWEKHIVQPQAQKILGSPIKRIETYGSYSCRNIAGTNKRSEHAYANAVDISGFLLQDGRLISVKSDWGKNTPEAKFLKKIHSGACALFSVTLGPDYNAAHADHLHLDMGSGFLCE